MSDYRLQPVPRCCGTCLHFCIEATGRFHELEIWCGMKATPQHISKLRGPCHESPEPHGICSKWRDGVSPAQADEQRSHHES